MQFPVSSPESAGSGRDSKVCILQCLPVVPSSQSFYGQRGPTVNCCSSLSLLRFNLQRCLGWCKPKPVFIWRNPVALQPCLRTANFVLCEFLIDRTFSSHLSFMELSGSRVAECKFQERLGNFNVLFSVFKREERQERWLENQPPPNSGNYECMFGILRADLKLYYLWVEFSPKRKDIPLHLKFLNL